MGTRGLLGIRKNGEDKATYNHFDSYPSYLGKNTLEFIAEHKSELNKLYDNIVLVDNNSEPTDEQVKECEKYTDLSVSEQSTKDWYCLLRNSQGDLTPYLNGLRYMIDNKNFIKDSLFCEYAYIINLDDNVLEFWIGFQKTPTENNRYGVEKEDGYYPCKNVLNIPLDEIKADKIDELVEKMEKCEGQS